MTGFDRREVVIGAAAFGTSVLSGPAVAAAMEAKSYYGLIGKMRAKPGARQTLLDALLEGSADMPGCLSYIVALDPADADAIWITEVWEDEASHKASLQLPAVQAAITKARPVIAGFDSSVTTQPVGGTGLPR